jgi:glycosyltransferase involved in cell wall biosynthesis
MSYATNLPSVLYLQDHFGYADGVVHGITVYNLAVVPALSTAGVDIRACFLREPHPAAKGLVDAGIPTVFLSAHPLNPFVVFKVARLARRWNCRVIHAAGMKGAIVARIVAPFVGARTLIHLHDVLYPSSLLRSLHRVLARSTDRAICVSKPACEVAVGGYHVEQSEVVYNGIRIDRLKNVALGTRSALRRELGLGSTTGVVTVIGRIYPIKGHKRMLEIMARVVRSHSDTALLIVGDGPDRTECEELATRLGITDAVLFIGQRSDVPELLVASDVVAMPSMSEGLGLVAIEAHAAGRPVVAFRVGGIPDVVTDGVNGTLVADGDLDAFAAGLVALLRDPALRERYGEAGRVNAERFTLEGHIDALLSVYRQTALVT